MISPLSPTSIQRNRHVREDADIWRLDEKTLCTFTKNFWCDRAFDVQNKWERHKSER